MFKINLWAKSYNLNTSGMFGNGDISSVIVTRKSRRNSSTVVLDAKILASSVNENLPTSQINEPGVGVIITGFGIIEASKFPNLPSPEICRLFMELWWLIS